MGDHRAAHRRRAGDGDPEGADRPARARAGRGCADSPSAETIAAQAPALLEACGLAGKRALALRPGGPALDLGAPDWRARLLAIPEIGTWTVEIVALHGLGQLDEVPAADLGYLKLVGRLLTGHPKAVADEAEVRGVLRRLRALGGPGRRVPAAHRAAPAPCPARNSFVSGGDSDGGRVSSWLARIQRS